MTEEIKNLRRKLKKARESGKLQEISDCCCNLAAYLSEEGEHEESLKLYKESLRACEALADKQGVALANRMVAEEYINLGYFDEALNHVNLFLKYARDEKDKVEEQRGLVLKGHVYFTQAEFLIDTNPNESKKVEQLLEQSMDSYRKSFVICNTELNDISEKERLQMKARLLQNKSLVLIRQNKLDYAQAHLIRAIKICDKEKLNDTEHLCYLSLGDLYIKKGDPHKALHVFDKALEMSHSMQKKQDSLLGKARTYVFMENFQQAKIVLKKAYKLKEDSEVKQFLKRVALIIKLENNLCSIPDTDLNKREEVFKKLGKTYYLLKCHKKGIKCYLNMLNCAQKQKENKNSLIKCYNYLCKAFTVDKQFDKALFYSNQAVESVLKFAPEKANKIFLRIGVLHELNGSDFEEIYFAFSKAKAKAQQFQNQKLQIKCLKHLIKIGRDFKKPDLVEESEKELSKLKEGENDLESNCESEKETDSDMTSEDNSESSDSDFKDLVSDSDVENEEYDRPKERCKRTKFRIKRNEKGETDLHVAAIKGNYKRVKLLLEKGHPVNVRDTAGWTPLHEACNHGYVDIVNILLDFGANINDKGGTSCDGTTPLHDAATNGQLEVIETLIKRGASTLVLNDYSETPLQCLLAWKKKAVLDAEEESVLKNIIEALKSPLDSVEIKRHLKPQKSFSEKIEPKTHNTKNTNILNILKNDSKPNKTSALSEYRGTIELFRRKRQSCEDSNDSEESSEDEDIFGKLKKKSKTKNVSACEEYRKAIEELRHKPKKLKTENLSSRPKSALIDEKEYVENCIMDNDDDDDDGHEEKEEEKEKSGNEEEDELNEEKAKEIFKSLFEEQIEQKEFSQTKTKLMKNISEKSTLDDELKAKPCLKSVPLDLEKSFDLWTEDIENDRIMKKTLENPKIEITVKLFSEKLKIQIDQSESNNLKSDWLIREVAKQRPNLQNDDNFVTIKCEGGIIEENTTLAALAEKEVDIVLTKWKSLPLSERYEKVCTVSSQPDITSEGRPLGFKHSPHPRVVDILKKSLSSRCLTLSNLKLSSLTLIPICKAIRFESFLQVLNLSNNYFGDKGIELIVKIFEKCIVEELNVSNCNITSSGIYLFSDALFKINELSKNGLEVLDFSCNPITDDAVVAINSVIEQLPNLRILNIDDCELETSIEGNNSTNLTIRQSNKFESSQKYESIKPDS